MTTTFHPSAVISLDNVLYNLKEIRSRVSSSFGVIAVVKDNAYGCGAASIAGILESKGDVSFFAVASASEAFSLRSSGIQSSILILGKCTEEDLRKGAALSIVFTCNSTNDFDEWKSYTFPIRFHLNINTGMNRLGMEPNELSLFAQQLSQAKHLQCQGVFTHMASADCPGTTTVDTQLELFRNTLEQLKTAGCHPEMIHVANSATALRFPPDSGTHFRPGIALYGCLPDPCQSFDIELKTVLTLKGAVIALRKVSAGTAISYGGNYITSHDTTIATIGIGYAHGVPRYLSSRGSVLIGGKRFTIAGNVTMDYIMADMGADSGCSIGDEAVIIGEQGNEVITPDEIAAIGSTIGYEVLCNIGIGITRTYTFQGRTVATMCDFHF